MLSLYDRASMERALTLPLDQRLHDLLARRIAALVNTDGDLTDMTSFLVIDSTAMETDLNPLTDPDGNSFGSDGFVAWWDWLAKDIASGLWEMIICVGDTGFAYHLIILPDADPELLALCNEYGA